MLNMTIGILLWIHIAAGFTAFFIAPVAIISRKGGRVHRRWGKIYFWALAVVAATAVMVASYRPSVFLLLVAVFSFYIAFSGYRVLKRKRPDKGDTAAPIDWIATSVTLIASVLLLLLGIQKLVTATGGFSLVYIVFGIFGSGNAARDMYRFIRPSRDKMSWFFDHMGGMVGSYIAALTAFSAVNFVFLPPVIRWLWPSVIGSVGLTIWIRYYKTKFRMDATETKRSANIPAMKTILD